MYHLVVFDFCDTLTNFQTGDGFVKYVVAQRNSRLRRIYLKLIPLLVQLRFFAVLSKLLPVTNLDAPAPTPNFFVATSAALITLLFKLKPK